MHVFIQMKCIARNNSHPVVSLVYTDSTVNTAADVAAYLHKSRFYTQTVSSHFRRASQRAHRHHSPMLHQPEHTSGKKPHSSLHYHQGDNHWEFGLLWTNESQVPAQTSTSHIQEGWTNISEATIISIAQCQIIFFFLDIMTKYNGQFWPSFLECDWTRHSVCPVVQNDATFHVQ